MSYQGKRQCRRCRKWLFIKQLTPLCHCQKCHMEEQDERSRAVLFSLPLLQVTLNRPPKERFA